MRVVITGGAGFIGRTLARHLVERGALTGVSGAAEQIDDLVLFDAVGPPADVELPRGPVRIVLADARDPDAIAGVVDRDDIAIFHLASMVSAGCEADFDGALGVNVDGFRNVLEACRARSSVPRLVFTSSIAAFGGPAVAGVVGDTTKLTPETTYGMTKVIGELLVNEYTRKGFLDGRSARLPTVIVRPGRPNAAASSWVSGLFREPIHGEACTIPVDASTPVPVSGYTTVVENLIALHELDAALLGRDRAVNLPSLDPTADEMIAALRRSTDRPLGPITFEPDPAFATIFEGWAKHAAFGRALDLGLVADESLDGIVATYLAEYGPS